MKDELSLLKKLYMKFENCTVIEDKLENYYQATLYALFLYYRDSHDMDLCSAVEKMLETYYGKLLFYLFFEDVAKLNLTIIDNHINQLTPEIKDLVLTSEPIFQLMHFKIDNIIKLDQYSREIGINADAL